VTPVRALVVGGEPSFVDAKFAPHLEAVGIHPIAHWSWDLHRAPASFPDCELVVVIKDMTSHKLRDVAVSGARKRGIRIAEVPRKWAKAHEHLLELGLTADPIDLSPSRIKNVGQAMAIAKRIARNVCREGRLPSSKEIQSKTMLEGVDPSILNNGLYQQAIKEGRDTAQKEGIIIMDATRKTQTASRINEWTALVLDDNPELVLDMDALYEEVTSTLSKEFRIPNKSTSQRWARKLVLDASTTVQKEWAQANRKGRATGVAKAERDRLTKLKTQVLLRYVARHPTHNRCEAESYTLRVFGTGHLPDESLLEVKRSNPGWTGVRHPKWAERVRAVDAIAPIEADAVAPKKHRGKGRRPAWEKIEAILKDDHVPYFSAPLRIWKTSQDLADAAGVSRESVRQWLKVNHDGDWTRISGGTTGISEDPSPNNHVESAPELESEPPTSSVGVTFGEQVGEQVTLSVGQTTGRIHTLEALQKDGDLDEAARIGNAVAELIRCGIHIDFSGGTSR
jgi:hypothetical protein